MKKATINMLLLLPALFLALTACSSDDDNTIATYDYSQCARGTFTDERDGNVYHYITIGNLDWMTENARYDTGTDDTRSIYPTQGIPGDDNQTNNARTIAQYGYLYSFEGAQQAAPEGWRVPTDDDWKALETALGMSATEADADDWRGNGVATSLTDTTGIHLVLGGFQDVNSTSFASKYYYMSAMGYYWTSTSPSDGLGYFRKILYNDGRVYRHTTKTNNMLSVRFVRER